MTPALLLLAATAGAPPAPDLKLPQGFRAELYADDPVAPDVYTLTIDDAGRVVIAAAGTFARSWMPTVTALPIAPLT
jgi:hypothetical protein